jgi:hypothetical protein
MAAFVITTYFQMNIFTILAPRITYLARRTSHIAIFISSLILAITSNGQTGPEKKVIATLGPGETLAYGENCFRLDLPSETFSFVTVTGSGDSKQYYCYDKDGSKTGPVQKPDASYWAGSEDAKTEKCSADYPGNMAGMSQLIDFSDGSVNFQGKKFGPYGQVILFNQPENESGFCAVGIDDQMKLTAFDNSGRKIIINGMPEEIIMSPDGKNSVIRVKGTKSPFDADYFQYMMDNPDEVDNPKVYLFSMDGKKYGPYSSSSFRDTWFTEAGQWIIYAASQVFLNGNALFKTDDNVAACDIWISPNGKDFGWANYEKLVFSDGTSYQAPIVITRTMENGISLLKWLALEDGKNLVFYTRSF